MYVNFWKSVDRAIYTTRKINLTKSPFYGTIDMMKGGVKFMLRQKRVNISLTELRLDYIYMYITMFTYSLPNGLLNLC